MGILMIVFLTFAATADSFIIAFNYGIKKVIISNSSNFFISFLCLCGTLFSMFIGKTLGGFVSAEMADIIGSIVLVGFAVYMLFNTVYSDKKGEHQYTQDPSVVDKDNSKVIELRESLLIGIFLSINNMGMGIGAGIAGMSVSVTPLICAAASFIFIKAGCILGRHITSQKLSKNLEMFSAVLVLLLGIMGFFN
ncbi:manganese efflux pump [Anaerocolumna sp. MB42-C2]|uniref:manganese efflux pump n=1 Tax=Anaerocolumna sp. MB42-C2 TaxID=3070997 RepID=UPI0027E08BF2|nr:manganese efflux pump [Anaerocolumna sp. MB42-C2]WMJ87251.1 manganese efflux pump [Anaerocolumna sp. MB42-C2]